MAFFWKLNLIILLHELIANTQSFLQEYFDFLAGLHKTNFFMKNAEKSYFLQKLTFQTLLVSNFAQNRNFSYSTRESA